MMWLSLLIPLATAQDTQVLPVPPADEIADEARTTVLEWEGGSCSSATGKTAHHLFVEVQLGNPKPLGPQDYSAARERLEARACGEGGAGYLCKPAGEQGLVLERGQRVNGLMRLPVATWMTVVEVGIASKTATFHYSLYAEGSGPGAEGWRLLCEEARGLAAVVVGD